MKQIVKKVFSILLLGMLASSCLKSGLKPLPSFNDANIDRWDFEYRWNNEGVFTVIRFTTATPKVSEDTMYVTTTVPAAAEAFTQAERSKVSLSNIIGMCNISTAATISPVDGAPKLGVPADFSNPASYEVTAADGKNKRKWILVVTLQK